MTQENKPLKYKAKNNLPDNLKSDWFVKAFYYAGYYYVLDPLSKWAKDDFEKMFELVVEGKKE